MTHVKAKAIERLDLFPEAYLKSEEDDWHSILSKKYLGWLQRGSNHGPLAIGIKS